MHTNTGMKAQPMLLQHMGCLCLGSMQRRKPCCVSVQVSGKGLRELTSFQHLARLSLKCCTNVNDHALKAVGQITSLTYAFLPSFTAPICLWAACP